MIVGSRLTLHLQYGKLLKDLSSGANDTIVATFADGSTAEGTLIVGCDGANSVVRHCILDESSAQVEDLDIQMLNVSCTFPKDTAMLQRMGHPVFKNSYHPDGFHPGRRGPNVSRDLAVPKRHLVDWRASRERVA